MAYLDSAGNVDPTAEVAAAQWQAWTRTQHALMHAGIRPPAPAVALPTGAEKASKGDN